MAKKTNAKSKKVNKNVDKRTGLQQVSDYLLGTVTMIYVFCMMVIYPLYFRNKYYDMGDTKYQFFKYASLSFLGVLAVSLVLWMVGYRKEKKPADYWKRCSYLDYAVIAFGVVSLLSYLFSGYKETALWGYNGWYMGLVSQLIFVFSYFFVSRFWSYSPFTVAAEVAAAGIVYVIGVLQRFSIDPLDMYEDLGPEYVEKFISTLGQTTWYTSYTMLVLPLGFYFFWTTDRKWVRIVSGIFTAFGFAMVCTTNSDSAYVALVLILMVFFWFSLDKNERFVRFWQMLLIGLASFRLVGILQTLFPETQLKHVAEEEAITEFVVHSKLMLIVLIVVLAITAAVMYGFRGEPGKEEGKAVFDVTRLRFLRYVMLAGAGCVLLGVFIMILLVTKQKLPEGSAFYDVGFFNFVDVWGNHRGFNWRMAMTAMEHASFKDIVLGVGPDCFANAMDTYCQEEVRTYWRGLQLACAHNEFLNMMVTEGILGLLSYLAIYFLGFWRLAKNAARNLDLVPYAAAVAAYVGHNFFCYQQCITTATIFILLGVGELLSRSQERPGEVQQHM